MPDTPKLHIVFYCQHVLGIGHFHRSLEICRVLARRHKVTMITGGPPVKADFGNIENYQLPGLQMDSNFRHLVPCDPSVSLDALKTRRKKEIFNFFARSKPEVFITELYPFGRKAFAFELDPVLKAIQTGELQKCLCCASVRDILVEKVEGREKFEQRVVDRTNAYFDVVLVHADPTVIELKTTFGAINRITAPIRYTGFISKDYPDKPNPELRREAGIPPASKLIVASIGGGNVGHDLLEKSVEAFTSLDPVAEKLCLQLFCGPYCPEKTWQKLKSMRIQNLFVSRFTDNFPGWLATADFYAGHWSNLWFACGCMVVPFVGGW